MGEKFKTCGPQIVNKITKVAGDKELKKSSSPLHFV